MTWWAPSAGNGGEGAHHTTYPGDHVPGLLNYTTKIPAAKTISEMQQMLASAGASSVSIHFAEGIANGLTFEAPTKYGPRTFTMIVDTTSVQKVLQKQRNSGGITTATLHSQAQAERVAWRVARSWLEAQLAMIQIGLASIDQIMLPYLHVAPEKTLYAAYQDQQDVLQLTAGE